MLQGDAIRQLVREVLAEELGRLRRDAGAGSATSPRPQVREEVVSIAGDADLAAFVGRLMALSRDGHARREIEEGRWVFRLGTAAARPDARITTSAAAPAPKSARIEKGLVTERQIDALPQGTSVLEIGRAVRFTPLARDRVRRRGIAIERTG